MEQKNTVQKKEEHQFCGRELSPRTQKRIAIGAVVLCVLATAGIIFFIGVPMVHFASEPEKFRAWVDGHGIIGVLAYMGMVILQIVVAIIPGEPLEIAGGYAFGTLWGTLLYLIAAVIGSVVVFCLVRRFGMRLVEVFFSKEKIQSLRFLQVSKKRAVLFFFIFMIPGTPKDLLCYLSGLTNIPFSTILVIFSVGRIPSVISSAWGGDALGSRSYVMAAIVFGVTLVISLLGLFIYTHICNRQKK